MGGSEYLETLGGVVQRTAHPSIHPTPHTKAIEGFTTVKKPLEPYAV